MPALHHRKNRKVKGNVPFECASFSRYSHVPILLRPNSPVSPIINFLPIKKSKFSNNYFAAKFLTSNGIQILPRRDSSPNSANDVLAYWVYTYLHISLVGIAPFLSSVSLAQRADRLRGSPSEHGGALTAERHPLQARCNMFKLF